MFEVEFLPASVDVFLLLFGEVIYTGFRFFIIPVVLSFEVAL